MEDDDRKEIKVDGKLNTYKGNLTVNILELVNSLDDETKQVFLQDGGWRNLITAEMAKDITNKFSRENYDSLYTDLRLKIINSESMPKVIREWAKSLIASQEYAKEREKYWDQAYWELRRFVERINNELRYEDRWKLPEMPKDYYGKIYHKELIEEVNKKIEEWEKLFPEPESKQDE